MYAYNVGRILGDRDPNDFLMFALAEPDEAEKVIVKFILDHRDAIKGVTLKSYLAGLKGFLKVNRVVMGYDEWKSMLPQPRAIALDRSPTLEEVRTLMRFADQRLRLIVTSMSSGGFRVGAWTGLRLEHFGVRGSGVGILKVYAGEPEEYTAFVSPEAVAAINDYVATRKRAGEQLTPQSLLLRDKWNYDIEYTWKDRFTGELHRETGSFPTSHTSPMQPKPFGVHGIQLLLFKTWKRAGVRVAKGDRTFKLAHGFRKFFKTHASRFMSADDVEVLMGHYLSYYRPTLEHLEEAYMKAVPALTIGEEEARNTELKVQNESHQPEDTSAKARNFKLERKIEEIQKSQDRTGWRRTWPCL